MRKATKDMISDNENKVQMNDINRFQIDEEDLSNIQQIGRSFFNNPNDPRSITYNRKLIRPQINWVKVFLNIIGFIMFFLILHYILWDLSYLTVRIKWIVFGISILTYILLSLKSIEILVIHIYQCLAPERIRRKCRFEPSCSQYMVMSINKYGPFLGVYKGVKRLRRCNINDGGYDFP